MITLPQIEETRFKDSAGKTQWAKAYMVGKRDTYVVVAQLSPEFTARLVDRWQELEEQVRSTPITPALPDFSNPAIAARTWAEQYEQRQLAEERAKLLDGLSVSSRPHRHHQEQPRRLQ